MIIAATLSGWSASSRPLKSRTHEIVSEALEPHAHEHLAKRAMFTKHRARRFRRFIQRYDFYTNTLLCVGKSLGAKVMVEQVLNRLPELHYKKVLCLTIDPCWPLKWDWTPNLNRTTLRLTHPVDWSINVYLVGQPGQQCGAILAGPSHIENRAVLRGTHHRMQEHAAVQGALDELVKEAHR